MDFSMTPPTCLMKIRPGSFCVLMLHNLLGRGNNIKSLHVRFAITIARKHYSPVVRNATSHYKAFISGSSLGHHTASMLCSESAFDLGRREKERCESLGSKTVRTFILFSCVKSGSERASVCTSTLLHAR